MMPFDLVAEVTCFFGRVIASSNAYFRIRSVPVRREHRLLRDEFAVRALEHPPADGGIFALGVFPHHVEVDIRLGAPGQRRAHPRHQLARPHIRILVEAAPDRDQQPPQARRDPARPASPPRPAGSSRTSPTGPARRPASSGRCPYRSRTTSRNASGSGRSRTAAPPHPAPSAIPARFPCRCRRPGGPRYGGCAPWPCSPGKQYM